MAESIHEQIAEKLQDTFEAIVANSGTTYWHTPDIVARVHHFEDSFLENAVGEVIYLLMPGDETFEELTTGSRLKGRAEFFLVIAKKFAPDNERPGSVDGKGRQTVINQLVRDAMRALAIDVTLAGAVGGSTINVFDGEPVSVDRSQVFTGWALAQLRFVVGYQCYGATP